MPTQTSLLYDCASLSSDTNLLIVGRKPLLKQYTPPEDLGESWDAMLKSLVPADAGSVTGTWVGSRRVWVAMLPERCSRHNSPTRAWAIPGLVKKCAGKSDLNVVLLTDKRDRIPGMAMAVARAFPIYDRKSGKQKQRTVKVCGLAGTESGFQSVKDDTIQPTLDGIRLAARLFDTPPDELSTDAFVEEARAVVSQFGGEISVIAGEDLDRQGFGGLWGVGRAATRKPALVTLKWSPANATRSVAWVGKGIVYDTGGLSIKTKTGMPGMKGDMGGAAAVLGAFCAAVRIKVDYEIMAVLCLAENAVGPDSIRPDDILSLRSGKTVEVNNTDAEGRLVLGDGVAWAAEHSPDLIIDLATLTGAALVATGKVHAALYCNDDAVETAAVKAGRSVGEPAHPLVYAPELFRKEFKSSVADMKNSVKDRANAQSSCAGQFVGNHLPEPSPRWLHIDLAGPSWGAGGRGTGYGVGLLLALGPGPTVE